MYCRRALPPCVTDPKNEKLWYLNWVWERECPCNECLRKNRPIPPRSLVSLNTPFDWSKVPAEYFSHDTDSSDDEKLSSSNEKGSSSDNEDSQWATDEEYQKEWLYWYNRGCDCPQCK